MTQTFSGGLLALLNSNLLNFYFSTYLKSTKDVFSEIQARQFEQLPIQDVAFTTPGPTRSSITAELIRHYPGNMPDLLDRALTEIKERRTDTVHDLLAYLAQQMIDLNKEKQAGVGRFLGWLEGQIDAPIDDLDGKTFISGYLGDYQKGEDTLPADELIDRLSRNKSKFGVPFTDALEHRIRQEYQASLDALLPVKQRLADTDWLIDQIVYRLYGLTDEEIAIVEGRE